MARTHSRTKGKSRSHRPTAVDLSFVSLKPKEIETLIVEMSKQEALKPSQIGLRLRDKYAVPSVKAVCGKTITQILEESGEVKDIPEDLRALTVKATALNKHLEINPRDTHNKRGLLLVESKIRRLSSYYKKHGKVEKNWSYK